MIMKKYVSWTWDELRYLLSFSNADRVYSPDVEFCGYSIPHPSEAVLHLRIQTWGEFRDQRNHDVILNVADAVTDGVEANEVLRKGLEDLSNLCGVVVDKFTASRNAFNEAHRDGIDPR